MKGICPRSALLLACLLVAPGCTADPAPPVTASPAATSSASATTATTQPSHATAPSTTAPSATAPSAVTLQLGPLEALAARGGVEIEASGGVELVRLSAAHPEATVHLDLPASIELTYVAGEGRDTSWTQQVDSGADVVVIQQSWRTPPPDSRDVVALVWQSLGDRGAYRRQLDGALSHVTVVSPVWWFVQADGTVSDRTDSGYVTDVHDRDVAIWPAVAGLDADANHALLADPARRAAAVELISNRAAAIGADGVNIDIEGFREEDATAFTDFVRDLTAAVHGWGGIVSYDLIPRSDTWVVSPPELAFWSTAPQRRELAEIVDYTVVMAYDEHNRYRPAGPVASPGWVEEVLTYTLRYADPHRVILGIPFYGRIWNPDDLAAPRAVGAGSLPQLAADGRVEPDDGSGLERVELPDGRFFWLEDPTVLAARLALVDELGLAGWAAWRLGFDSDALWEAIGSR